MSTSRRDYRPEIDGLRALAVLAVLVYHAKFSIGERTLLTGGFLGVDVFFVISGYLITTLVLRDLEAEHFSLGDFYTRRVRRLLPALAVVLLCCVPAAVVWLLPEELLAFTRSLLATNLFVSNLWFWSEDPYTAAPSLLKPLLHTWSLAVEEQFYLLFPVALAGLWARSAERVPAVLIGAAAASLALAELGPRLGLAEAATGFFALPQRLWELGAGAWLASREARRAAPVKPRRGVPTLGLLLVVASFFLFDDATPHPSLWTAIPVLGVVLLLANPGADPWVTALLRWRVASGIGLISYSLYLWHQPVFAFSRIATSGELPTQAKLALVAVCIGAAALTWKWVETPCRDAARVPQRRLFTGAAAFLLASTAFVFAAHLGHGWPQRFPPWLQWIADPTQQIQLEQDGAICNRRRVDEACRFVSGAEPRERWFLVGDSNANRLGLPLWEALRERDVEFVPFVANGCYYAPGLSTRNDGRPQCHRSVNLERQALLLESPPATVVLFGALPAYYHGGFRDPELPPISMEAPSVDDEDGRQRAIRASVTESVRALLDAGHRVMLVYPTPEPGYPVARRLAALPRWAAIARPPPEIPRGVPQTAFQQRTAPIETLFDGLGEASGLVRVRPETHFCVDGLCRIFDEDVFYFADAFHLSLDGAAVVSRAIVEAAPGPWPPPEGPRRDDPR
ncbi:MAG: acyltransferase family protein [Myxococcota bacterium]